ncbi:hypothetical protein NC797_02200 [Aquibacillus sp. 3ASR75-11]|uniref:Spore coat protein n=1 Tax=Terrihalobacillus insolitus TaxID=2950438 RepID=A0A9X3WRF1_9BACI|nr:hypothetical protein [Terrihalobacillus insolitus]MDC3411997.1 hypothetical protein [Terrihalobacillus insolitus]MDC3423318.1 hypothetical protein [Terrihalobacillus insolitus]
MQQQNQPMGQNQAQPMPQPPNVVSSKDLLYLTDMLSWNLNAIKKAHFYAEQCTIPEIKTALEQVCQMHQNHYNTLLQHLNQNPQTMM